MKKTLLNTLIVILIFSCGHDANHVSDGSETIEIEEGYVQVKSTYLDSLMMDICDSKRFEFIDLYQETDSIASDEYENSILIDSLQSKGFEITGWGRGNWEGGPRIVSFTLSKAKCECQVDKLYHSADLGGRYRVTERIKCEAAKCQ